MDNKIIEGIVIAVGCLIVFLILNRLFIWGLLLIFKSIDNKVLNDMESLFTEEEFKEVKNRYYGLTDVFKEEIGIEVGQEDGQHVQVKADETT